MKKKDIQREINKCNNSIDELSKKKGQYEEMRNRILRAIDELKRGRTEAQNAYRIFTENYSSQEADKKKLEFEQIDNQIKEKINQLTNIITKTNNMIRQIDEKINSERWFLKSYNEKLQNM